MWPNADVHYRGESHDNATLRFLLDKERGEDIASICQLTSTFVNDPYFSKRLYTCCVSRLGTHTCFYIVFVKPVRGLVREILQHLIDDEDLEPMAQWISSLAGYLTDVVSSNTTR